MQIKIFTIPIIGGSSTEEEMNRFLRSAKILSIESQFIGNGNGAFWSFCVRYLDGQPDMPAHTKYVKKDYKTILDEATFQVFSTLRMFRKEMATQDVVPAFAIFTDEELANIAQLSEMSLASIQSIKGIGDKRVAKYGEKLLAFWKQHLDKGEA